MATLNQRLNISNLRMKVVSLLSRLAVTIIFASLLGAEARANQTEPNECARLLTMVVISGPNFSPLPHQLHHYRQSIDPAIQNITDRRAKRTLGEALRSYHSPTSANIWEQNLVWQQINSKWYLAAKSSDSDDIYVFELDPMKPVNESITVITSYKTHSQIVSPPAWQMMNDKWHLTVVSKGDLYVFELDPAKARTLELVTHYNMNADFITDLTFKPSTSEWRKQPFNGGNWYLILYFDRYPISELSNPKSEFIWLDKAAWREDRRQFGR